MPRSDFRVHHNRAGSRACLHRVHGGLQRKGRRRTGHVHVVRPALRPQGILHLHGDGRVGTLEIGAAHNDGVDVGGFSPGLLEGPMDRMQRDLTLDRVLLFASGGQMRTKPLRVEHTRLLDHIAVLNPRGLDDESLARQIPFLEFAAVDLLRMFGIPRLDRLGE